MATFTWLPSRNPGEEHEPKIIANKFGDNYEQRVGDGINNDRETWNLSFNVRDDAEASAIMTFFKARGGTEKFTWTPPGGVAGEYVCKKWRKVPEFTDLNNITATFEQVFEL